LQQLAVNIQNMKFGFAQSRQDVCAFKDVSTLKACLSYKIPEGSSIEYLDDLFFDYFDPYYRVDKPRPMNADEK